MLRLHMLLILSCAMGAAQAADPVPEIQRGPAKPQATGVVHALRTIPEACARLEGQFTASARCAPRARLVDASQAKPSAAGGWRLNDVIRVPSAACPAQQAVVRIWRKEAGNTPPKLDAQGRSRIYLKDGMDAAKAGDLKALPMFAVAMAVEGKGCR